ncbi:CYTH domain-containing protein [Paenibacillus cellulosilyticus]|uniref:CYTH domain-containing protein n=1 Tax=Paenibacillus cellulosilyticus TaxID=375489 RepID=A0A2V2YR36_9BACL|nr:CYTH domain-containing protein [Paenibacillus cellulosilyticus]PWV99526.1 CYTH domain-containing protein [Paenibacillus cellulosilyticus]QKS44776.1 CYTH domain-containing protein [Paenibacillus cellulosilyticus]
MLEIESKFLLENDPKQLIEDGVITFVSEQRIEQTYLAIDEQQEVRVRRLVDLTSNEVHYTHTFKSGNGLIREEIEYEITASIYEQLMSGRKLIPLTKNRITAKWDDRVVEIDIYDQIQLSVVEVEFDSEDAAHAFVPPAWFGKDIGSERQYSNKKVWRDLQNGSI